MTGPTPSQQHKYTWIQRMLLQNGTLANSQPDTDGQDTNIGEDADLPRYRSKYRAEHRRTDRNCMRQRGKVSD